MIRVFQPTGISESLWPKTHCSDSSQMAILQQQQSKQAATVHDDSFNFDALQDALEAFARGEFLVVMDDEGRENEGDLICAASLCTTERMAFMIKHTS
jgi:hypothetical protein